MAQARHNVNRFTSLFAIDARSLLVFRKGVAVMLIYILVSTLPDLRIFYSNEGVFPFHLSSGKPFWYYLINLHGLNGHMEYQLFLVLIALLMAVCLFFDHAPRLMLIGSWILFTSLCNRNRMIIHGAEAYLRLLLFWGMFLPIPKNNKKICNISTAAILIQVCMVYFFNALYKSSPVWWPQGMAVYNALQLKTFVTPLGSWVGALPMPVLRTLTYLVYFAEWSAPLLLFSPYKTHYFRMGTATALIFMHMALGSCLYLGPFSGICITALLLFIPKQFWDRSGLFPIKKRSTADKSRLVVLPVFRLGTQFFLVVCLFFALAYNLSHVPRFKDRVPAFLLKSAEWVGLKQEWNMFAPYPLTISIWYFVEGQLANGQTVNMLHSDTPVSMTEPADYREIYPNRHWVAYIKYIFIHAKDASLAHNYADYLAREWNRTHKDTERVVRVRLYKGFRKSSKSTAQGMLYFTREIDAKY